VRFVLIFSYILFFFFGGGGEVVGAKLESEKSSSEQSFHLSMVALIPHALNLRSGPPVFLRICGRI
jgi:hypothetical protein